MPQMSPMNWIMLFFIFNISIYMMMVKMYYMFNKILKKGKENCFSLKNFSYKL